MSNVNQRKFPRTSYPCDLTLWVKEKFDTIKTETDNLSAGGLMVYIDLEVKVDSKADVRIDFLNGDIFECRGKILRCEKKEINKRPFKHWYAVAIAFDGLDETKQAHIKGLVDKLATLDPKKVL